MKICRLVGLGRQRALYGNMGAIHVHLAIPDGIKPGPGKKRVALWSIIGQDEFPAWLEWALANIRVNYCPRLAPIE